MPGTVLVETKDKKELEEKKERRNLKRKKEFCFRNKMEQQELDLFSFLKQPTKQPTDKTYGKVVFKPFQAVRQLLRDRKTK